MKTGSHTQHTGAYGFGRFGDSVGSAKTKGRVVVVVSFVSVDRLATDGLHAIRLVCYIAGPV